ncbi:MAG: DUF134 domain-containing protein [Desulfatibacillaceae bacterium]
MVRPQKHRTVKFNPKISYFKPRGVPMVDLEETRLTVDELEALRLADLLGMSHEAAGKQMDVSRATFGRIVQKARQAVADALVNGKAIMVEGGNYNMQAPSTGRPFVCESCGRQWDEDYGTGRPEQCPSCGSPDLHRDSRKTGGGR